MCVCVGVHACVYLKGRCTQRTHIKCQNHAQVVGCHGNTESTQNQKQRDHNVPSQRFVPRSMEKVFKSYNKQANKQTNMQA